MIATTVIPMQLSVSNVKIPMEVTESNVIVPMAVDAASKILDKELYHGEYEVTPRLTEQTLDTENKYLRNDVTIQKIPVVSTSNTFGGQTVVIG